MQTLDELVGQSPVFAGLQPAQLELIAGCGHIESVDAGARLFREGDLADTFFLVRRGRFALTTHVPARGDVVIETLDAGEVIGWSWLYEPYRWHFDARAVEDAGVIVFDGACLRGKIEADHTLGYELMRRFGRVMIGRLQRTRTLLLDVYGDGARN
jgi:CRP/FNR family transcriptional regulator, cyclic AMP receptor protein